MVPASYDYIIIIVRYILAPPSKFISCDVLYIMFSAGPLAEREAQQSLCQSDTVLIFTSVGIVANWPNVQPSFSYCFRKSVN